MQGLRQWSLFRFRRGLCSGPFEFLRDSLETIPPDSDALSIVRAIREHGVNDQTLSPYRPLLSNTLVVEVLSLISASHSDSDSAINFFFWTSRQVGYSHSPPVFDALLKSVNPHFTLPDHLLHSIHTHDSPLLANLLNFLIRNHCRNGCSSLALDEFTRLNALGLTPTPPTYSALLHLFLRANNLDSAFFVYNHMSPRGVNMDHFTLGWFAQALCRAGKSKEALALFHTHNYSPNTVLYTQMISGLCQASLFKEALDFLDRMRSDSCVPNNVTYGVLLSWLLKKKQLVRCKRILSTMIPEGCFPDPTLFHSLVYAFCESGDFNYAYHLMKTMLKRGCQPSYVLYNVFIGGICGTKESPSSDLLNLADKAYNDMLRVGAVLNKVNVVRFVGCLCGAGKFEQASTVIRVMMSKGFVPDKSTYLKVIKFLCSFSKIEKASLLFEEMKANGVVPDAYTYTLLIVSFCKAGLIHQARNLFEEMLKMGRSPNVVTYTALIHAYLKAVKVFDADVLFDMMQKDGCVPNIITYTALIDGLCKAGETEKALLVYAKMKGNIDSSDVDIYFRIPGTTSNQPDIFTHGALVDGLCKAHRVKDANDLLKAMSTNGCEPNNIVYDALIDGLCKDGKLADAQIVLSTMSDKGYSPSEFTYGSFIDRLFKEKRLDLVLKVLAKMQEDSCPPNVVIYTQMIDGLCKLGKLSEAYKLLLVMEEKECHPNVVTYTAMIDGFGKAGQTDKCLDLLQAMCSKGCAPNFVTYRVLIIHCCAAGLLDKARELLNEMKQTYWPEHMASYQKVIEGYSREFLASLGILNELSDYKSVPISSAYIFLIDKFIKEERLEAAVELYEEVLAFCPLTPPSNRTCTLLIESLSKGNKVGKGFKLFADMLNSGRAPELSTFVHLIRGLAQVDRWDDAIQLSDSICHTEISWLQQEESSGRR